MAVGSVGVHGASLDAICSFTSLWLAPTAPLRSRHAASRRCRSRCLRRCHQLAHPIQCLPPAPPQATTGEAFVIALAIYAAVCLGILLAFTW